MTTTQCIAMGGWDVSSLYSSRGRRSLINHLRWICGSKDEVRDKAHVAKKPRALCRHGDFGTPFDGAGNDLHRPRGALLIGVDQDPSAAIFDAIARRYAAYNSYYLACRQISNFASGVISDIKFYKRVSLIFLRPPILKSVVLIVFYCPCRVIAPPIPGKKMFEIQGQLIPGQAWRMVVAPDQHLV